VSESHLAIDSSVAVEPYGASMRSNAWRREKDSIAMLHDISAAMQHYADEGRKLRKIIGLSGTGYHYLLKSCQYPALCQTFKG
jgi:hypothetical protein